jgi:hypothetical protein
MPKVEKPSPISQPGGGFLLLGRRSGLFRLNRKNPNGQDRAERDQAAYGPAHGVARFIIICAAHRVGSGCSLAPVQHDGLLKSYLGSMRRCACISNQPIRLLQDIGVRRLFSGEEANGHKDCTKQQAHQHDFPVRPLVGVVK